MRILHLCFNVAKVHRMTMIFVTLLALLRHHSAYGYAPGGLIWRRNLKNFVPIANISTFEAHRHQQEFSDKIRELENHNFHGNVVKLGHFQEDNIVDFYDNDTKISGVCGEIWNLLADYSNFTLSVLMSDDGFGKGFSAGTTTFTGVVRFIKLHKIDVIPNVGLCEPLSHLMNFTTPIWLDRFRLHIRPVRITNSAWVFRMFTREVWCTILALVLLLSVTGYWMQKISIKSHGNAGHQHSLHDHLFYTFATICAQNSTPSTMARRRRILCSTKSIFAWLLMIVSSSNLISRLMNERPRVPFNGIASMFSDSNYTVALDRQSYMFASFQRGIYNLTGTPANSSSGLAGKYKERLFIAASRRQMYEKICLSDSEYSIVSTEADYESVGRRICELVPSGNSYRNAWATSGVIDGFKYKRTFDIGILKLKQFGLISGMRKRWVRLKTNEVSQNLYYAVNFDQVSMLFAILSLGMMASLIILISEIIISNYNSNRRQNLQRPMLI